MRTYLYDGSFDGLLTAYFYAYKDKDIYDICRQTHYQPDLLSKPLNISTEEDKAQRIVTSVQQTLSSQTMRNLYLLYLSELPRCDFLGLQYLRLCYQQGAAANLAKHHPVIRQVDDACRKVKLELDHMKGFLRFQEIDSLVFYACFAPDHNQLPLLQPHLERRIVFLVREADAPGLSVGAFPVSFADCFWSAFAGPVSAGGGRIKAGKTLRSAGDGGGCGGRA